MAKNITTRLIEALKADQEFRTKFQAAGTAAEAADVAAKRGYEVSLEESRAVLADLNSWSRGGPASDAELNAASGGATVPVRKVKKPVDDGHVPPGTPNPPPL